LASTPPVGAPLVPVTVAVTPATALPLAGAAPGGYQLGGDGGCDRAVQQLDPVGVGAGGVARRLDRDDGDAVNAEVSLGPDNVALLGPAVKQGGIE